MNRFALIATPAGAVLVAVGALLRWITVDYTDELRGPVSVPVTGRELVPALLPLAAAALAALGATLATRGVPRRVIGALVAVVGIAVVVLAVMGFAGSHPDLVPMTVVPGSSVVHRSVVGVAITVVGGLLLCLAGVRQAVESSSAGLGKRYERRPSGDIDDETRLWRELDAHRDPTLELPADTAQRGEAAPPTAPPAVPTETGDTGPDGRSGR